MIIRTAAKSIVVELFTGAKCAGGIPFSSPLMREALLQASLDREVTRIEYVTSAQLPHAVGAVVIHRDGKRFALDIRRGGEDIAAEGAEFETVVREHRLELLPITETELRREPRFGNSKLAWLYARHPVNIDDRMRILQMLADEGPLTLGEIVRDSRFHREPSSAVMALACSDLIELDLDSHPLGPETTVRIRRPS